MLQISIKKDKIKYFMNILFKETVFDTFDTREAVVTARFRTDISGELAAEHKENEQKKYASWGEIKPFVLSLIKGNKPSVMRFVFSLPPADALRIDQNAAALFLNMNYDGDTLGFTTATAQKTFALNKELDRKWEIYIEKFFNNLHIEAIFE